IGTHALLYETVSFSNLGLVVIDEQHKFGVAQRARLTSREPAPDVLVMTATPIPRTLTMTVYGDLDVSMIDEMPRNRGKISTTVVEVGVDIANATVMLIENAERFGLAQLHQLRGRIGRGEHKSYCILLSSDPSKETAAKLAVLEKTSNGFEVAEADWDLRGPGDLLGTAQSGLPALRIGNLKTDAQLMRRARKVAMSIFADDPRLESPENQRFRSLIVEQE